MHNKLSSNPFPYIYIYIYIYIYKMRVGGSIYKEELFFLFC
ncbi:MAG: hypothetical protein N7Q72_03190 [Spiroplasma sp. Tabriz.8]|nr:hypothetical protein [Spiroplasma sp. Tabriz.8]